MKRIIVVMAVLLVSVLIIGCATPAPAPGTTPAAPTSTPAAKPAPSPAPAAPSAPAPAAKPAPSPAPAPTPAGAQQYGGTLNILTGSTSVQKLGTPWEASTFTDRASRCAYENLVTNDEREHTQPWLAESWKTAPDGKSITFYLRKGIKFHDGTDFNAEAVKFNMESWGPGSTGAAARRWVTSIDVVDEYTVRVNLKQYDAMLMLQLSEGWLGLMCSPTAAKKPTSDATIWKDHLVGTGPFKIAEYKKDSYAKFVKFDGYWQKGKPYLDAVIFTSFADGTSRSLAFQAGAGQFLEPVAATDVADYKKKGFTIESDPRRVGYVSLFVLDGANKDSPFADLKVRQAVDYAIDKKGISALSLGLNPPAYQQALPEDDYYVPGLVSREYNVAKAKQLLAEAGYGKGFKSTIHGDTRGNRDNQTAIQTMLKEVGIDCDLDIADLGRYTTMATGGWKGVLMPGYPNISNVVSLVTRFGSPTYFPSMYRPAGFQEKWDSVVGQMDDNIRMDQLRQLIKTMADEVMTVPITGNYTLTATNGKAHDIGWVTRKNSSYWDPVNAWLSK